jgi:hypothetical protein
MDGVTLEERVGLLEGQSRRFKLAIAVAFVGFGTAILLWFTGAASVRARQFEVVNWRGQVRARLGLESPGESVAMRLYDSRSKSNLELLQLADGTALLRLFDRDGKLRAGMAVLPDSGPHLVLHDAHGKNLWKAP